MGFEVEQKFRTDDHTAVTARLDAIGAERGDTLAQVDLYWNHPARDFAQTGEAFRVRQVGSGNAVTYKGPRLAGPTKTRPEYEVAFADGPESFETMRKVLDALGFRPVAEVRKSRTPYHLTVGSRRIEVVLDEVDDLGTFIEVEALARDESDLAAAQAAVLDLAGRLALSRVEPRSYLRMVLESRGS